jgi:glycosyltransferase involved in cell wall biosynthesis
MRVLFFVERFWPFIGGVEVISARVVPELVRRGIEVKVVTTRDEITLPEYELYEGVEVHRLRIDSAIRNNDIEAVAETRIRMTQIKNEFKPDLMHMVFMGPGIYFAFTTAQVHPCPIILSFHGSWLRPELLQNTVLHRAVEASSWYVACSESALADLRSIDPRIGPRSNAILNGLDAAIAHPSPLDLEAPILFCSARIEPEKGLDLAIEAVRLLRPEFPRLRLRIAGDGTARPELETQAARAGIEDAVEFLGWQHPDRIPGLIDESAAVLVPSLREGFGLIALEGMLGARPVVAARTGGLPEVLGDEGGVLVEPESAEAIATALRDLFRDPERATRVGLAGRARAQARFSLARCVDAHESLYRELMLKNAIAS